MSDSIATYSFLPWLRQGLANQFDPGAVEDGRVTFTAQLALHGDAAPGGAAADLTVDRKVQLYGPGDVCGLDQRAIFRTEPHHWTTNFESNFLAAVDFYDEDLPWRYTPALPDENGRLQPWLALVVLEEREKTPTQEPEFVEGSGARDKPLPYIEVKDSTLFPLPGELWAFAHVHVNRSLAANAAEFVSTDVAAITGRLQAVLRENPDLAYSRLLCPRRLAPNKAYHAFLIPAFESGRRAGLGLEPYAEPALPAATTSAWADYAGRPEPTRYPVYHRFYFRTASEGDFESLVRLLEPRLPDHRLGRRDIDVQDPGLNVRGVQAGRPELGGILRLGGALKVPDADFTDPTERAEVTLYETWATPYPQPIQEDLARTVNLADDYAELAAEQANLNAGVLDASDTTKGNPDPVITPPLYGTWHARTKRLLQERDGTPALHRQNWVHEVNLDPRFRVAAGLGVRVVQDQQEKYMNAAWEQIGRVLEANRRIRHGQFSLAAATSWHTRHIAELARVSTQKTLMLVAPLSRRVLFEGSTVRQKFVESRLTPALTAPAFRRLVRPRSRLMRSLPAQAGKPFDSLLERVNLGEVSAAPPKVSPAGAETLDDVAAAIEANAPPVPAPSRRALQRFIFWLLLLIAIALLFIAPLFALPVLAAALFVWLRLRRLAAASPTDRASEIVTTVAPAPESIDAIPASDFRIQELGTVVVPSPAASDSAEAVRFKSALRELSQLFTASREAARVPAPRALELARLQTSVVEAIAPARTIPKRILGAIGLPARVVAEVGEDFVEAMAYPVIEVPMYGPLKELGVELLLPNINLIQPNSVLLLETNQKFIESYMLGLNHEFARELLWREYPTDQRGSYFRQFWDVAAFFDAERLDAEALHEKLYDITRLDHWSLASGLGKHNNRVKTSGGAATVVLIVRGELLKRYPNTVIYAHRARWQRTSDGKIDHSLERLLEPLTGAEETTPPHAKVRTPLYDAKVEPDIYFFGFDLTVAEARGDSPADDPGWFFVLKERPGEPRFGIDLDGPGALGDWNDLSWKKVQVSDGSAFLRVPGNKTPALSDPGPADLPKQTQYLEDKKIAWGGGMSSADLAYILFQAPVLLAIHASKLIAARPAGDA